MFALQVALLYFAGAIIAILIIKGEVKKLEDAEKRRRDRKRAYAEEIRRAGERVRREMLRDAAMNGQIFAKKPTVTVKAKGVAADEIKKAWSRKGANVN